MNPVPFAPPAAFRASTRPFARLAWAFVLSLTALTALSACGGGSEGPTSATAASADSMSTALGVSAGSNGDATSWTLCAGENQTCTFSGTRQVRYGTVTQNVIATFTNGVACSNGVFGDPVYGTVKSCWYADLPADSPTPTPTPTAGTWVACAIENQSCSFTGTRVVRYGTPTTYASGTYTDGVQCTNGVFGDPLQGTVKSCYLDAGAAAPTPAPTPAPAPAPVPTPTPTPTMPDGPSGANPPVVFNASGSVRAGDVISVQGENFGGTPRVFLESASTSALEIVNRVGTGWLAVRVPAGSTGALNLRLANATGTSARIKLNGARPLHLDALQLVPGGAFRVFGRNLMLPGSTPLVTVNGAAAGVDVAHSDEHMLTVLAPSPLTASSAATVVVDNGNGSGPATLDRTIESLATGGGDPFGLGVGWGAGFAAIAGTVVDAATDPRLAQKAACNGSADDTGAIQAAIELAASGGGGLVKLPAGTCRLAGRMSLRSRVVVQGAGKAATNLVYESNYPFIGVQLDLVGVRNLTLTNSGAATEGPLLKDSTRVVMQNLRIRLMTSRQMFLSGNRHFVVSGSDLEQTGSISEQGPYILEGASGLVFENNTTQWVGGAPAFGRIHDGYLHANRFTRDARPQNDGGTVHSMTLDFAYRVAVVGNTFDVANGPITNKTRNDGETILTEGGGAGRTENLGTVASAGSTTLTDPANAIQVDPFGTGAIPENYGVAIVGGTGAGQTRRVVSYSAPTLTVDRAWDVIPDNTSHYATFVWGMEKSLIKGNVLSQNPRGIWLYHTAVRDTDVIGNTITEGGGIYLRSYQNLSTKSFMPIYNVRIAGNTVVNTSGNWMSYVNAVFVNSDARAFGIAMIGIEMRANALTANVPNVSSNQEEYAGTEGYMNMMRVENYNGYESSQVPRLLGTLMTGNTCTNCEVAMRVGTGAGGTTILDTRFVNVGSTFADWATTSTSEKSTNTLMQ